MSLPESWELLAELALMEDVEGAIDAYYETSVSDLMAARFTWREFLEKGEMTAPGSLAGPLLIFHLMTPHANAQLAMSNYRDLPVRVYYAISTLDEDGVAIGVDDMAATLAGVGQAIRDEVYGYHIEYTLMRQPMVDAKSSNPANQVFTRFKHPLMAVEVAFTMTGALQSDLD